MRRGRVIRLICLGLGVLLLGYTLSGVIRNRDFLIEATQADGVVVALRAGTSAPVIRFSVADGSVVDWSTQARDGAAPGYQVGEHLHVLYLPATPSVAVIGGYFGLYGRFLLAGLVGLALVAIGRREIVAPVPRRVARR